MARVTYGALVTEIKGSIGGSTFQSNAYGFTMKNKPNMVKPNTEDQERSKLIFSVATKSWVSMSSSGRTNWNTFANTYPQYAKNNPSSQLSGYAAFVKWHAAYFLGYGVDSPVDTSPVTTMPAIDTVTCTLVNAASVLTLNLDWVNGGEDWSDNIYITRAFLESQNFVGTQARFLVRKTNSDDSVNVTALYTALFGGLPAVGRKVNLIHQLFNESGGKVLADVAETVTVT